MVQTKEGAAKAAATIKATRGEHYFALIGAIGGRAKVPKGFALNKELAREAGRKGGHISKRGPSERQVVVEPTPAYVEAPVHEGFSFFGWLKPKSQD